MESLEVVGKRDVTLSDIDFLSSAVSFVGVTRRIIGHIRLTCIRMVHHQFATK